MGTVWVALPLDPVMAPPPAYRMSLTCENA
jgi:hypothetical protein